MLPRPASRGSLSLAKSRGGVPGPGSGVLGSWGLTRRRDTRGPGSRRILDEYTGPNPSRQEGNVSGSRTGRAPTEDSDAKRVGIRPARGPQAPWHFLYLAPDPHQHGSLRPIRAPVGV